MTEHTVVLEDVTAIYHHPDKRYVVVFYKDGKGVGGGTDPAGVMELIRQCNLHYAGTVIATLPEIGIIEETVFNHYTKPEQKGTTG